MMDAVADVEITWSWWWSCRGQTWPTTNWTYLRRGQKLISIRFLL